MKTLEWEDNRLKLIDQTKLPDELTYVWCDNYQDVIVAIRDMVVRGAPAIGVAAGFGMALADMLIWIKLPMRLRPPGQLQLIYFGQWIGY